MKKLLNVKIKKILVKFKIICIILVKIRNVQVVFVMIYEKR